MCYTNDRGFVELIQVVSKLFLYCFGLWFCMSMIVFRLTSVVIGCFGLFQHGFLMHYLAWSSFFCFSNFFQVVNIDSGR